MMQQYRPSLAKNSLLVELLVNSRSIGPQAFGPNHAFTLLIWLLSVVTEVHQQWDPPAV
jgi:hypothetical protein